MEIIRDIKVYGLDEVLTVRKSFGSESYSDSEVYSDSRVITKDSFIIGRVFPWVKFGPKDLALLEKLKENGDSHAKVNRFITVYLSLNLPRRVWVDFDTYRVGHESVKPDDMEFMSDSTMHTLGKGFITAEDCDIYTTQASIDQTNHCIQNWRDHKGTRGEENAFLIMKSNLPEGFLQDRRLKVNYQSLRHIHKDRHKHKQPEFRSICEVIALLPYAKELIL